MGFVISSNIQTVRLNVIVPVPASPQTGDETHTTALISLLGISGMSLLFMIWRKKEHIVNKDEDNIYAI